MKRAPCGNAALRVWPIASWRAVTVTRPPRRSCLAAHTDALVLAELLRLLLADAIRHSVAGKVSLTSEQRTSGEIFFVVRATGPGGHPADVTLIRPPRLDLHGHRDITPGHRRLP